MSSEIIRYQTKTNQDWQLLSNVYTGVKQKSTLQEEYKYLNTNVFINTIIYVLCSKNVIFKQKYSKYTNRQGKRMNTF